MKKYFVLMRGHVTVDEAHARAVVHEWHSDTALAPEDGDTRRIDRTLTCSRESVNDTCHQNMTLALI